MGISTDLCGTRQKEPNTYSWAVRDRWILEEVMSRREGLQVIGQVYCGEEGNRGEVFRPEN